MQIPFGKNKLSEDELGALYRCVEVERGVIQQDQAQRRADQMRAALRYEARASGQLFDQNKHFDMCVLMEHPRCRQKRHAENRVFGEFDTAPQCPEPELPRHDFQANPSCNNNQQGNREIRE